MPGKSLNKKALAFCAAFNESGAGLLAKIVTEFNTPPVMMFDAVPGERLKAAGYTISDDGCSAVLDKKYVSCLRVNNDFSVYLVNDDGKLSVVPTVDQLTRPLHVHEFVDAIGKETNGWGEPGDKGLMYRGHNLFEIYVSDKFNRQVTELIQNDEEVRQRRCCDEQCQRFFQEMRGKCDFSEDMKKAAEECCRKHMIPVEEISSQEVYLGYVPSHDYFVSAWDVFGSDSTGCVLVAFKIDEYGRFYDYCEHNDEYRDPIKSVYDASDLTFYAKRKQDARHGAGKSLYELITSGGNPEFSIVDIDLTD